MSFAEVCVRRARKDGDFALRFMSIRNRRRWNPRVGVEVRGKLEHRHRHEVDLSRLSDDQLAQLDGILGETAPDAGPGEGGASTPPAD